MLALAAFAFVLRVEHRVTFYDLGPDKVHQLIATGNYAEGRGISECSAPPEDLSQVTCRPQTSWASAYPILMGVLLRFTGDLVRADWVLILVGLVLFLAGMLRLIAILAPEDAGISPMVLFLVFSAFSFTPYHYFPTTDLLAAGLFAAACACVLDGVRSRSGAWFITSGIFIFACAWLKYSFYPFIPVLPGALVVLMLIRRDKSLIRHVLEFAAPIVVGFLVLFATIPQHLINQANGSWTKGWNFGHLLQFDPFALKTLFFIEPILSRLDPASTRFLAFQLVAGAISLVLIAVTVLAAARWIRRDSRPETGKPIFAIIGILTILFNVAILSWVSIRLPEFPQSNNPHWTFVCETRYFAPSVVFILAVVFILPYLLQGSSRLASRACMAFVLLIVGFAGLSWAWKYYDIFVNHRLAGTYAAESAEDVEIARYLISTPEIRRDSTVLGFTSIASGYGMPQIADAPVAAGSEKGADWDSNGGRPLASSQPRTVIVRIDKTPSPEQARLLSSRQALRILELSRSDLYRFDVSP